MVSACAVVDWIVCVCVCPNGEIVIVAGAASPPAPPPPQTVHSQDLATPVPPHPRTASAPAPVSGRSPASCAQSGFRQYEVVGRHVPTERDPNPKAYRIKLFSKNEANAKSRFWYFIRRVVKMKKAHGEILQIREVTVSPLTRPYGLQPHRVASCHWARCICIE